MALTSILKSSSVTSFTLFLGLIVVGSLPANAASDNSVPGLIRVLGTGEGITPGASIQDSRWTIQNFPSPGSTNAPASTPVSLYIPSTTAAFYASGTSTTSTTNPGVAGTGADSGTVYRWGTANPNNNTTSVPGTTFGAGTPNYSYVVSTSFTVTKSATYNFSSRFSGDNRANIWLGGTVNPATSTGNCTPPGTLSGCPITGGTFLGGSSGGPASIYTVSSNGINLAAGSYTLNYVVTDFYSAGALSYGSNGLLVTTTLFTETAAPVPGPLPALGAGVCFAYSRKIRRRIKSLA